MEFHTSHLTNSEQLEMQNLEHKLKRKGVFRVLSNILLFLSGVMFLFITLCLGDLVDNNALLVIFMFLAFVFLCGFIVLRCLSRTKSVVAAQHKLSNLSYTRCENEYAELKRSAFRGMPEPNNAYTHNDKIIVKSRSAFEKYDRVKYIKDNRVSLDMMLKVLEEKQKYADFLSSIVNNPQYQQHRQFARLAQDVSRKQTDALKKYAVLISYISSAGNCLDFKTVYFDKFDILYYKNNPSLFMSKGELNKLNKEQEKECLEKRKHYHFELINKIIDKANTTKSCLVRESDRILLDDAIAKLLNNTINSITKVKSPDSEEWDVINSYIQSVRQEIDNIAVTNQKILDYYESSSFKKIKETSASLMGSQQEFNDYINEKAKAIATYFGSRVVREETVFDDKYNYVRTYKKEITPFTANVSAQVFASAENNPLDYVIKYFYPDKKDYPEQIQGLQFLVGELETLEEAKQIIENHKKEYAEYLTEVPEYIWELDAEGFYKRLGFADISENTLTIKYKFVYTSEGGFAQRSFNVPMTEETIVALIKALENKLTYSAFAKEQRSLMTKSLRTKIKERDNYTCCYCGNSTYKEPNLLLEVDHIKPIKKGGITEESNLQTLCWKCNRAKSTKDVKPEMLIK